MRKGWLLSKTGVLAVVLPLCGAVGLLSPPSAAATVTVSPLTFEATEGTSFSGTVATADDTRAGVVPTDLSATIDWGDGTTTAGTVTPSSGSFDVNGTHTYAEENAGLSVIVTVTDTVDTMMGSNTSTAIVGEGDALSGTPVNFGAIAGTAVTATVATFTDTFTGNVPGDFTATIDWGDATTSAGTVSGSGGSFQVSGTHTYAGSGTFSVTVTLSDDAPGTATATVTSMAHVGGAGLTVFPTTFAATEAVSFTGLVATWTDSRAGAMVSDFTVSIDWGDGTTTAASNIGQGFGASFFAFGKHTYAEEGVFSVPVKVTDNVSAMTATATSTANVAEGDALTPAPVTFSAIAGVPFTGVVATFTDTNTSNVPGDFVASIDWGDATTTAGTVTGVGGALSVSGTHIYSGSGGFTVKVTLADDAPGTATATATSTANVAFAVAAVPALDWRGLAALTLALAAAGLLLLRKA